MDSPKITYKYYSNPAFCAQSEVVFSQQGPCVSPRITATSPGQRIPPLGANSPRKPSNHQERISAQRFRTDISDNHLRNTHDHSPRNLPPKPGPKPAKYVNSSSVRRSRQQTLDRSVSNVEELEMSQVSGYSYREESRIQKHRYEEIPDDIDDFEEYSPTKKRMVESETDEYNVDAPDENEYREVPTEIVKSVNGKMHRYAIVPSDEEEYEPKRLNISFTSPGMTRKNIIATQKLHELLSTPKKTQTLNRHASNPSIRTPRTPRTPVTAVHQNPFQITPRKVTSSTPKQVITPSKSCANLATHRSPPRHNMSPVRLNNSTSPRAQKTLNYEDTAQPMSLPVSPEFYNREYTTSPRRQDTSRDRQARESQRRIVVDRTTAVISPRLAKKAESLYSEETTASAWRSSWNSLKTSTNTATLSVAALMLTMCGALTSGLSFYMMYNSGRKYYLDFGVLSGFTCLLLGLIGFRSRRYQLLPNRNYITGYILLSSFSLMSCVGLLILLVSEPRPGTPYGDLTSGAVCGLSVLSLFLASLGVVSSYCCKQPPPDNRVASDR